MVRQVLKSLQLYRGFVVAPTKLDIRLCPMMLATLTDSAVVSLLFSNTNLVNPAECFDNFVPSTFSNVSERSLHSSSRLIEFVIRHPTDPELQRKIRLLRKKAHWNPYHSVVSIYKSVWVLKVMSTRGVQKVQNLKFFKTGLGRLYV